MQEPRKTYILIVNNNENDPVEVEAHLIEYFLSIKTMIDDFGENNNGDFPPIPITLEGLTPCMLRQMIAYYKVFDAWKKKAFAANTPEEKLLTMQVTQLALVSDDELASFAKAANFLDVRAFLNALIDAMRAPLLVMPTEALRIKAEKLRRPAQDNKRKADVGVEDAELWGDALLWRSTRLQYRREVFIRSILGSLLGDQAAGPLIDYRIRRFADPLIGFSDSLIVRYLDSKKSDDDSVFIHQDTAIFEGFELPESYLSWSRGMRALYKENLNDIVMDELFFAVLNDAGKLSVFGEHGGGRSGFEAKIAIDERPVGTEPAIAMWTSRGRLFALTHEALTVHQAGDDRAVDLGGLPASSVLEVYGKEDGALLLTHDGLYQWTIPETFDDRSEDSDFDFSDEERAANPVIEKINVFGLVIEKVWASERAIFVVASDGRLYVKGEGTEGELGLGYQGTEKKKKYTTVNTQEKWVPVALPKEIDELGGIRLITGEAIPYKARTIIVAGNKLFVTNSEDGLFKPVYNGDFTGRGDVVSVKAFTDKSIIVATTIGLYIIGSHPLVQFPTSSTYKELGGSDSAIEPYKLKIPYNGQAYDLNTGNPSNKKARLLKCTICFAPTEIVFNRKHAVCGSYCARKLETTKCI